MKGLQMADDVLYSLESETQSVVLDALSRASKIDRLSRDATEQAVRLGLRLLGPAQGSSCFAANS
jgi:hypothetical protein